VPGAAWATLAAEVPALVMLDRIDPGVASDAIVADDEGGGRAATALLIAHGARHIAFVGEHLSLPTIAGRHRGYLAALADAGLPADPRLTIDQVRSTDEVAAAVAALLQSGPPVDAIFAGNNRSCIGTLTAFRALGTRRALVGFDEFEAAPLLEPAVTVVTHDVATMGRLAARALLARIDGSRAPSVHTVLPTTLVIRGSERLPPQPAAH
jgi:LacI family transcriptional regulator